MSAIKNILQCIFRMLPWPTEPGLRSVGQPGRKSPVLVTCYYDLTVRRLQAALEGIDAWIVVAPSSGVKARSSTPTTSRGVGSSRSECCLGTTPATNRSPCWC